MSLIYIKRGGVAAAAGAATGGVGRYSQACWRSAS